MKPVITIHADEISLKGGNRPYFQRMFLDDIKSRLKIVKVERGAGKYIIRLRSNDSLFNNDGLRGTVIEKLKCVPGAALIFNGYSVKSEIGEITDAAVKIFDKIKDARIKGEIKNNFSSDHFSFKIEASRSFKNFPLDSIGIARHVGAKIVEAHNLKVDLKNPDAVLYIDIDAKESFLSWEKTRGMGGLPKGTGGKLISLISGGIDSPVASWMMIRRGALLKGVHFQNATHETLGVTEKIKSLVDALRRFQPDFKISVVPFGEIQRKVVMNVRPEIRMLVYRRIMLKLAEKIAEKNGAAGLITGDSLSQVASQTLQNLNAVYIGRVLPILSPLMGMNKTEIVEVARKIGTYEISILPHEDCCSMFLARHPETRARFEEIIAAEKNSGADEELLDKAIQSGFEV